MGYIYKIINDINDKVYIGQTSYSIEYRFNQHCRDSSRNHTEQRPLYKAMNKYGVEHFFIELIEEVPDKLLNEREIYWIKFYNSYYYGYNATLGGEGKRYIEHQEVINLYKKLQNQKKVAEQLNINVDSVHNILITHNIPILSAQEVNLKTTGQSVIMLNKKDEIIKYFNSFKEAARYLIDNNIAKASVSSVSYHISEVCRGIRKTIYGYKWKFLDNMAP